MTDVNFRQWLAVLFLVVVFALGMACGGGDDEPSDDGKTKVEDEWEELYPNSPPERRDLHTAVTINNIMYIFGGRSEWNTPLNDIFSYSYGWDSLSPAGITPSARYYHAAAPGTDGMMYVFGGYDGENALADIWQYNPEWGEYGIWKEMSPLGTAPSARYGHAAANFGDKIYLFGGYNGTEYFDELWEYDPGYGAYGKWQKMSPYNSPPTARHSHSMVSVGHYLYVFGGFDGAENVSDMWKYNFYSGLWEEILATGDIPSKRHRHSAVVMNDKIYVFGGPDDYIWIFSTAGNSWRYKEYGKCPAARFGHTAVVMGPHMYVFGGSVENTFYRDLWRYNDVYYEYHYDYDYNHDHSYPPFSFE